MAKRKAKARTRTAGRKTRPRAKGATARHAKKATRKASSRTVARPKARTARKTSRARSSGASVSTRRAAAGTSRRTAPSKATSKSRKAPSKTASIRPKPAALSRERRQLREDDALPGAPSSLNFAAKASAAESGQQMYHQRAKEHTEGGEALTGGDVDSDWNDAYSSGEETPGGDMSTPDQDVVEEIGRALGVEYRGRRRTERRRENREPRPQPLGIRPGERRRLQGPQSPRLVAPAGLTTPARRE